jgi:O-antigen/teichoic acid export membrane protein
MRLKVLKVFTLFALAKLGAFLFTAVIAHSFGVEVLGITMTTLSVCMGAVLISKFGVDPALIKTCSICYAEGELEKFVSYIFFSCKLILRKSLIIAVSIFLATVFVKDPLLKDQLSFVALLFPLLSLLNLLGSVLKAIENPALAAFTDISFVLLLLSLLILLSNAIGLNILPDHIYPSLFLIVLFLLLAVSSRIAILRQNITSLSFEEKSVFKASLFDYFVPGSMHYLIQWGGVLTMSFFLSSESVGIFSVTQRASYLVNFILIVMNSIVPPRFAVLYKKNKIKEIEELAIKSSTFMAIFGTIIAACIGLFSTHLFGFLGVEESTYVLYVLIAGQLINVSTGSVSLLLNMTGHEKVMKNVMFFSAFISVLLLMILVPLLGMLGGAVALSIGLSCQNILATYKVYKILGVKSLPPFAGKLFYGGNK